jgi:hypothetical protein
MGPVFVDEANWMKPNRQNPTSSPGAPRTVTMASA